MSIDTLTSSVIPSLLTVALAVVMLIVVRIIGRRIRRIVSSMESVSRERRQQLVTLVQSLRWVASVLIVVVALLMVLGNFIDITPLLAGAGVAGLAVSLGAQTLIKDLVGGLLILAENQYAVGDMIQVGEVTGTVERLTLRATYVRDVDGRLHVVPNGEVRILSNLTKEWSRALVDLGVAYEEDLDHVLRVLERTAAAFAQDPESGPLLMEAPEVMGPISLGDWALTVRVMVKTRPGKQWEVARQLRKRILAACEQEGITLPYPRQEVLVRDQEGWGGS